MNIFASDFWRQYLVRTQTTGFRKTLINVAALVIVSAVAAGHSEVFLTWKNWLNIGVRMTDVVIIGMPFTLLMISGAFDLSVGSTMALAGTLAAILSRGMPINEAFLFGTLSGLAVGIVNSFLVVGIGINSFIATIGMLYSVRGVALLLSGGTEVTSIPSAFSNFGNISLGPVPIQILIAFVVVLLFIMIQRTTSLGRYSIASGSNQEASFLAGVPVRKTRIVCFLLTGLASGFAGVLQASQFGLGSPTTSTGLELKVILAVVVGGTSLFGGEGHVSGTVLGALIIGAVFNGMDLAAIPSYWQTVALGIILFVAVGIDQFVNYIPTLRRGLRRFIGRGRKNVTADFDWSSGSRNESGSRGGDRGGSGGGLPKR